MAALSAPRFNQSLKAFSGVIQVCAILGTVSLLVGIIWMFNALKVGDLSAISITLSLTYGGSGLIGLAIAGAFLRQTAKVIVEGLGGSIEIPEESNALDLSSTMSDSATEEGLSFKLTTRQYDAWISAGQPSLKAYAKSGQQDFMLWLEQNKK